MFEMGVLPETVTVQVLTEHQSLDSLFVQLVLLLLCSTCVAVTPGCDVINDEVVTCNIKPCENIFQQEV
jgi:hypothetical protein